MGAGEDENRAQDRPDPVAPVDLRNPYPSPIVVSGGGGGYFHLLIPGTVVEGLGGSSLLRERLNAILASEPYLSGEVSAPVAAALAEYYNEFFQRLEVSPYPSPIRVDPGGGWSVTIPIPGTVVEELGGISRLTDRLGSIYMPALYQSTRVDPAATVRMAEYCDRLLGQIETVINRPER